LPRELRDGIYEYVVANENIRTVRGNWTKYKNSPEGTRKHVWERRPNLCKALPLFHDEILEPYYRLNQFKIGCPLQQNDLFLWTWVEQAGAPFTNNLRWLQIQMAADKTLESAYSWRLSELSVRITLDEKQAIKVGLFSEHWGGFCQARVERRPCRNRSLCGCDVPSRVLRRLEENDVQEDEQCMKRLKEIESYAPVLKFAFQLLEISRLDQEREQRCLPWEQRIAKKVLGYFRCTECNFLLWPSEH
jgi:hypothetical protein